MSKGSPLRLGWLVITLVCLLIGALLVLVGLLVVKLFSTSDPTAIGALVTGIITAFSVAVAILVGFYAKEQLSTAQTIALWDFALRLDEKFREDKYDKVRKKIQANAWNDPSKTLNDNEKTDVVRYLRLFERVYFVSRGPFKIVEQSSDMWSYRLREVTGNSQICNEIFRNCNNKEEQWGNFIKLWKTLDKADYQQKLKTHKEANLGYTDPDP